MNVLFASSEVYPLVKTGGLADVAGSLPRALLQAKQDVRIILPAYQSVLEKVKTSKVVAQCQHYGFDIELIQTLLPGTKVKVLLVYCPAMFDRPGNPYLNAIGEEWQDNALRFALFNQVIVDVALNRLKFDWPVDLVHCNDWQCGLTPALLNEFSPRPATVFTIHNLAYQGIYPKQTFFDLGLPHHLWHFDALEFHDLFSFIKGGLNFADRINTVSPQYAKEIQTVEFGYGLQPLLHYKRNILSGILNGIDTREWNPATDKLIEKNYNHKNLQDKASSKKALQAKMGLAQDVSKPLIGMISRLVEQKGLDLVLKALPELADLPLQLVFLGSGDIRYEKALTEMAKKHPESIAALIGYDEQLSHQIEAGSDVFLMPSLFEPCGLNQFYSLRYGTVPLVTAVGGLADSVVDIDDQSELMSNGFVMQERSSAALLEKIDQILSLYRHPEQWKKLQLNGMKQDFSWKKSAEQYLVLYESAQALNPEG